MYVIFFKNNVVPFARQLKLEDTQHKAKSSALYMLSFLFSAVGMTLTPDGKMFEI